MNRILASIGLFWIMISGLACMATEGPAPADIIYIGSSNPLSGPNWVDGDMKLKSIQLAIDEANQNGGINGTMLAIIAFDDSGSSQEAVNAAARLCANPQVIAVIGDPDSGSTVQSRSVYNASQLPMITDATADQLNDGNSPFVFRISLSDTREAMDLAFFTFNRLKFGKTAVFYDNDARSMRQKEKFCAEYRRLGGTVTDTTILYEGDTAAQILQIRQSSPDMLFIAGDEEDIGKIAEECRQMGWAVPILAPSGPDPYVIAKKYGNHLHGLMIASLFCADARSPVSMDFIRRFKDKYGREPDAHAALAYDAARLIIDGMKRNGPTRLGVYEYLVSAGNCQGVSGTIAFNELHDAEHGIFILEISEGEIGPARIQP